MVVYTSWSRTDRRPKRAVEAKAEFYERIAGPYWDQVREVINKWWSHLPVHAQPGLRSRLLDRNSDSNVSSALWELYLHEMLLGSGCTVEIEQTLGSRGKNPDFLVTCDGEQFVLEAIWTTQRMGNATHNKLTQPLMGAIDDVPSPNFYLWVTVNTTGSAAPPQRGLKAGLAQWLAELDPDQVLADVRRDMPLPSRTWREAGWSISFQAFPRSPGKRGNPASRAIGMYPGEDWLSSALVYDAVKKKGKKYGELSLPFIVAVGNAAPFPDDEDIGTSLYGTAVEHIHAGNVSTFSRRPDGYWTTPDPGHSRVSGVLVVDNPAPWTWARNTPVLWCSPDPSSIKAPVLPTWSTVQLADGRIERQPPVALPHTAIGLAEAWPTGDPFPRHSS